MITLTPGKVWGADALKGALVFSRCRPAPQLPQALGRRATSVLLHVPDSQQTLNFERDLTFIFALEPVNVPGGDGSVVTVQQ